MSNIDEQLSQAAIDNNIAEVKRLIASGANPNYQEARSQVFSPLHFAAQNQNEEIIQLLLEAGASVDSVDAHGNTPLWTATFNYRDDGSAVKSLLEHGANPDHKNEAGKSARELAQAISNYDVKKFFK